MKSNNIYAQFNNSTIRVYQAFRDEIADEAIRLGKFGSHFRLGRMSWIKPTFLWMMYRSGWATKKGQERILAIDMKREGFDTIFKNAVLTSFDKDKYNNYENWKKQLAKTEARCQWDPDRDIYGNPLNRRTIQLGLRGNIIRKYIKEWIVNITDITQYVIELRDAIKDGTFKKCMLPAEDEYLYSLAP